MKKKFLTLLLATIMVLSTTIVAYAETKSTTSTFNVNESQINGTPHIAVPEKMPLVYDEATTSYMCKDKVIVYGLVDASKEVDVFVDKNATYINTVAQGSNEIDGYVMWGNEYNDTQNINVWTSEECRQGMNGTEYNSTNAVKKNITIVVLPKDILNIGDYTASIEFTYDANVLGMYQDIVAPNAAFNNSIEEFHCYRTSSTSATLPFGLTTETTGNFRNASVGLFNYNNYDRQALPENVNLNNYSFNNSKFASNYTNSSWKDKNLFSGIILASQKVINYSNTLKTIELSKDLYYFSDVQINASNNIPMIRSCFCQNYSAYNSSGSYYNSYTYNNSSQYAASSVKNLQTIIIPEGFTSENFRRYSVDAPTTQLRNSFEVIGNATVFIKDFDYETNKFVYIPNIVFRGTTDEWKELSGHNDWTFGNKANIVTVYCIDGDLVY